MSSRRPKCANLTQRETMRMTVAGTDELNELTFQPIFQGRKEPINQGMVGYFPAKFVMKIEETEKPFLVVKHCFGNSRRKELKAKENTVILENKKRINWDLSDCYGQLCSADPARRLPVCSVTRWRRICAQGCYQTNLT